MFRLRWSHRGNWLQQTGISRFTKISIGIAWNDPHAAREHRHPETSADEHDAHNWRAVLPASCHHLVDSQARESPANPHDDRDTNHALEQDIRDTNQTADVAEPEI